MPTRVAIGNDIGAWLSSSDCLLLAPFVGRLVEMANGKPSAAQWADIGGHVESAARVAVQRQANRANDNLSSASLEPAPKASTLDSAALAVVLGVSRRTAQRRCRELGTKVAGEWRIRREDAELLTGRER